MKTHHLATLLLAFLPFVAQSSEPITVLGLPLGGKLKTPIPRCKDDFYKSKTMCWLGNLPKEYNGRRSGSVYRDDQEALPNWTAQARHELTVDSRWTLLNMRLVTRDEDGKGVIVKSISTRFGPPSATFNTPGIFSAQWNRENIGIKVVCDLSQFCLTDFMTPEILAESEARITEYNRKQDARPLAP